MRVVDGKQEIYLEWPNYKLNNWLNLELFFDSAESTSGWDQFIARL